MNSSLEYHELSKPFGVGVDKKSYLKSCRLWATKLEIWQFDLLCGCHILRIVVGDKEETAYIPTLALHNQYPTFRNLDINILENGRSFRRRSETRSGQTCTVRYVVEGVVVAFSWRRAMAFIVQRILPIFPSFSGEAAVGKSSVVMRFVRERVIAPLPLVTY